MIPEPLLLTLFYAIAATAIIGAINARGLTRLAISCALALFCLGAAIFHTIQYLSHKESMMDALTNPTGLADMPPTFPVSHDRMGTAADSAHSSQHTQNPASPEFSQIVDEAAHLQNDLAAINLSHVGEMSETDYMQLRNKAPGHMAEARTLQGRISGMAATPPAGAAESVEALKRAIDDLATAARNLNRFFNAESGVQERALAAGFRNAVQSAGVALEKVQSRPSGTVQAVAP